MATEDLAALRFDADTALSPEQVNAAYAWAEWPQRDAVADRRRERRARPGSPPPTREVSSSGWSGSSTTAG